MDDSAHGASGPRATAVAAWLGAFGDALGRRDAASAAGLFMPDGHWRDVLAFAWRLRTVSGGPSIAEALRETLERTRPAGFRLHPGRARPRRVVRAISEAFGARRL